VRNDIEQGKLFVRAMELDAILGSFLRQVCREPSLRKLFSGGAELRILDWFARRNPLHIP